LRRIFADAIPSNKILVIEEDAILTQSGSSLRHHLEKLDVEMLHPIIMKIYFNSKSNIVKEK
jgi:hypothetical protein